MTVDALGIALFPSALSTTDLLQAAQSEQDTGLTLKSTGGNCNGVTGKLKTPPEGGLKRIQQRIVHMQYVCTVSTILKYFC